MDANRLREEFRFVGATFSSYSLITWTFKMRQRPDRNYSLGFFYLQRRFYSERIVFARSNLILPGKMTVLLRSMLPDEEIARITAVMLKRR